MRGEFITKKVTAFLSKHGIQHQKTNPYIPQQIGVAEIKKYKSLVEMDKCMIYSKGLRKRFWPESICCDNYILNMVSTKEIL